MSYLNEIINKNINELDWKELSFNPNAIPILEFYSHMIDWNIFQFNKNNYYLYERNKELFKNNNKFIWYLSLSQHIQIIYEENIELFKNKIEWPVLLSENPDAIEILIDNPNKINWYRLSKNYNIHQFYEKKKRYF